MDPKKFEKSYLEKRSFPFEVTEVRKADGEPTKIVGYAAVFNKLSDDLGGFREKIDPGFFSDVMGDDVRALFNHDDNQILGRTKNDTLVLEEDKKGLSVEIIPPDTTYANNLLTLIDRGDVDQMSFQWVTAVDEWDSTDPKKVIRTLMKAKELWDVSPVTFPAYPQTKAGVRMGPENKPELRSAKQIMIDYLEELLESKDKKKAEEENQRGIIDVLERKLKLIQRRLK